MIEEKKKFDELLDKQTWMLKTKNKKMWQEFCKIWSKECNGRCIFYKSPEYLQSFYDKRQDSNNYYKIVMNSVEIVNTFRNIVNSNDRVTIPSLRCCGITEF
jgi:hypothetical protein